MHKTHRRRPNRLKRFVSYLRHRRETTVPSSWLEPPDEPDIGVREPRRPRPGNDTGTAQLDPPV